MPEESAVPLTAGLPETILPAAAPVAQAAITAALAEPEGRRRAALAQVAADHPRFLAAWAAMAESADNDVEGYAYARVGYHRGLDALRGAGWRGSGYVRWRHESNRGFLRALDQLRLRAAAIGEGDEEERCRLFLHQLDPEWDRRSEV
ncbi:MAG TPA: DUF3151 family protein [Acidimicrobiales bacterium]|nr:DUF3151 family protein [Acidimicrobiales bacterium]